MPTETMRGGEEADTGAHVNAQTSKRVCCAASHRQRPGSIDHMQKSMRIGEEMDARSGRRAPIVSDGHEGSHNLLCECVVARLPTDASQVARRLHRQVLLVVPIRAAAGSR